MNAQVLKGLLGLALCLGSIWTTQAQAPASSGADERLSAVVLRDVDGKALKLSELVGNGRPVLLTFWATWCTPCKKELNNYLDLYEDWATDYGLQLVAVSIDDARNSAKVKSYIKGVRWPYRILSSLGSNKMRLGQRTPLMMRAILPRSNRISKASAGLTAFCWTPTKT